MKKRFSILGIVIASILLAGFLYCFGMYYVQICNKYTMALWDETQGIVNLLVALISFVISFAAFIVAAITYSSIDSVHEITSMDGNVLTNENYSAAFYKMINDYRCYKSQSDFEQALFDKEIKNFKTQSKTCVQYAAQLQDMTDNLLWFAYLNAKSGNYDESINELLNVMDKRGQKITSLLSSGNSILFEEHQSLIKYVLLYQSHNKDDNWEQRKEILNIRGTMFANKTTQGIYYDYLGLMYLHEASELIRNRLHLEKKDIFYPDNMDAIRKSNILKQSGKEIVFYIDEAIRAFDEARNVTGCDVSTNANLWAGFILYNLARAELLKILVCKGMDISEKELKFIESNFKSAISIREKNMELFDAKGGEGYLDIALKAELWLVKSHYYMLKKYLYPGRKISVDKVKEISKMRNDYKRNPEIATVLKSIGTYIDYTIGYHGKPIRISIPNDNMNILM